MSEPTHAPQPATHADESALPDAPLWVLRRNAEARIAAALEPKARLEDVQRLVHELRVQQAELELQNEQLQQSQVALETSRARYFDLYDHAPVGYVTLGLNGVVVEANRLAVTMLGTARHRLAGRRLIDVVVPEERPQFLERHTQLVRHRGPQSVELPLLRADGSRFWAQLQMSLEFEEPSGTPLCRIAIIDIDERIRLQRDQARLAAIVTSSDDAIIGRDLDGRITSWNGSAERLFGYGADEMLGRTISVLVPTDRRHEDEQSMQRLRHGEAAAHFETERLAKGGRRIPVAVTVSPILDAAGRIAGTSKTLHDISARVASEGSMRQRLRQLDLLAQTGQALIMGDADGDADAARSEVFELARRALDSELHLDYELGDEPGTLQLRASTGVPEDLLESVQTLRDDGGSLGGRVLQQRMPLIVERLHDSELPEAARLKAAGVCCYAGFPLLAHGTLLGVVAFASTSRNRFRDGDLQVIQTVCSQVSAALERMQLFKALQAREQALRQADRAKDDFIATLAHELRNPLAPVRNAVTLLRYDQAAEQVAWCRAVIDRQVVQMTHLLDDLLDVSRVTRNKIHLRRQRITLSSVIEHALESSRPVVQAQRHQLEVDLPAEPLTLDGDSTRLTQVFANLLNNAARYTEPGGRIRLQARRGGDRVRVSVQDNGIGIEREQLARVFAMFAQLTPALQRSAGGLGIGLALAQGLVEMHGGRIEAHSDGIGRGSTFTVELPLAEPAADAPSAAPPLESRPQQAERRLRVLVVDDNVDAAQTLAMTIRAVGHEAWVAHDARTGLALAEQQHPDAAVLDIGMPEMNGYELSRLIREQDWGRGMLLVACTGWGQPEDRVRARDAGFDHHLVKPVAPESVLELLQPAPPPPG